MSTSSLGFAIIQTDHLRSLLSIKREAPLDTIPVISPPVRHQDPLPGTKQQEAYQGLQVIPAVERCGEDVIVARPQLVVVTVGPVHDDEAANDAGEVAGGNVAPEV